jgi:hypothetical protein
MQDAPDVHLLGRRGQAAALRRKLLPKQQHQLVSRLPRQHNCVDDHGHGGSWAALVASAASGGRCEVRLGRLRECFGSGCVLCGGRGRSRCVLCAGSPAPLSGSRCRAGAFNWAGVAAQLTWWLW